MKTDRKIIDLKKEIEENKMRLESENIAKNLTPIELNTYLINSLSKTVETLGKTVEIQNDYIERILDIIE